MNDLINCIIICFTGYSIMKLGEIVLLYSLLNKK